MIIPGFSLLRPAATADRVVSASWFRRLVIAMILLAGVLAGIETNKALVARYGGLMGFLDAVVIAVFIAEAGLKITAHGSRPWDYSR